MSNGTYSALNSEQDLDSWRKGAFPRLGLERPEKLEKPVTDGKTGDELPQIIERVPRAVFDGTIRQAFGKLPLLI
jgi:hypothetical protein